MLPTCLRHFSPTFTSALPPLLPPHYRQNNICTDILHRHLHRQNSINLQRSQTNCKLITFPKLSPKKEEEGENRKKRFTPYYIKITPRPYKTYSQGATVQRFCILINLSNNQLAQRTHHQVYELHNEMYLSEP